jgi:hypothetical protein
VTRHNGAAPAAGVEGFDLFLSLEPIVANGIKPIRQIELMRLATLVLVHVSPIIREQLIESAPQRQITAVEHCFAILLKPVVDELIVVLIEAPPQSKNARSFFIPAGTARPERR